MINEDLDALLRLVLIGGATAPRKALLENYASPALAIAAGPARWKACGLGVEQIRALANPRATQPVYERCREWLRMPSHHVVGWLDPDYPALLRGIPSPPLALFVAGDVSALWHPGVAVVGSRSPTAGGRDNAYDFAHALAKSGLSVISGLAAGIDAEAHQGAMAAGGLTIAVLGTGPDVSYPRSNAELHAQIACKGAVVSEHPPGTQARREHFPSRNRILAGLALGTLVIEAAERSGALITAGQSTECGRDVFAVPGSIQNPMARGCHRLIRDGAGLVENATEVVASLAPVAAELGDALRLRLAEADSELPFSVQKPGPQSFDLGLAEQDPHYHRLWEALGHDPTGMDRLVERTGLTTAILSSMLLIMELEGRIAVAHGRYARKC